MSELDIHKTPLKRSASFMETARAAEPATNIAAAPSAGSTEPVANAIQQPNFQVGKPLRDDEQVFGAANDITETMARQLPLELLNNPTGSHAISTVIPIYTQRSPAEKRHLVQGIDAQTFYPPEACVFVANLPEAKSDTALEVGVTKAFSPFGPVFVKIRRDPKNMPFAFCQFTKIEHAKRAQLEGKGLLVEGRACRTEMVRANRDFVMFHIREHQISLAEARGHLAQFGEIEELRLVSSEEANAMNVPGAVFVRYKHFDPARDIISAYRYHDQFNVMAYDLKKSRSNQNASSISYLARYETDRRSIYIGNLPYDVENVEDILHEAASVGGVVESVQVIRKPPKNEGGRPMVFAFVVYKRPDEALGAVERLRGTVLLGHRLRVEKKNCLDQGVQVRAHGTEDAVVKRTQSAESHTMRHNTQEIPGTPYHAGGGNGVAGPSGNKVHHMQSVSPGVRYRARGAPHGNFGTPMPAYHHGHHGHHGPQGPQNYVATPQNGFNGNGFNGNGFNGQPGYPPPQYSSPGQGHIPRYSSPGYAMTPGYNNSHGRGPYGPGGYSPATPQMNHGMGTPYPGNGGHYYPPAAPAQPCWTTPYLQDGAEGYRFYAAYGNGQHRTPSHRAAMPPAARVANATNAGQTPTRAPEMAAAPEITTVKDAGDDVAEKK
ncbi:hypothetical protein F5Y17DRAFT_460565 [Xylariaceae sp. FL0594]|nr:hypothetical protein F5Y17DRAFT_460565 [Xylariaceae sp. FL0594]